MRRLLHVLGSCVIASSLAASGLARADASVAVSTTSATSDVIEAENDWLQCIKDHQYLFEASVWSIGPKGQMRASRTNCPAQIQKTGRALADQERRAGRPVDVEKIKDLLKISEERVRTAFTAYRVNQTERPLKPSLSKGLEAFNLGDYDTAYAYWLPKAQEGDAAAQNNVGVLFERGLTSRAPQSDQRAAEWFLLASRQGLVEAMRNLARVQARLGYAEASSSWLAQAAASQQQASIQQQQALGALGYAFGCAVAGGCGSPARVSEPATARPASPPPPPPVSQRPEVRCQHDPLMKDLWGYPQIKCR